MSWIFPDTRTFLQKLASYFITSYEVPKHIALIMDGNRRYAKERGLSTKEGHNLGYIKMDETFAWCSLLGVKEVTIYAFSIENFKRTPQEVANIMKFILSRITLMVEKLDRAKEEGTCIQFLGDWSMIPEYMKPTMAKLMWETRHGKKFRINIAIAYTGRNDIARGVELLRMGVNEQKIQVDDISEYALEQAWQLIPSYRIDVLLRTSGETRLSDFFNWEAGSAHLEFIQTLWPAFSFWQLCRAIVNYQIHRKLVPQTRAIPNQNQESRRRVDSFIFNLRKAKWNEIQSCLTTE